MKSKAKTNIIYYVVLSALAIIRGWAMYTFIVPNGFAPGGISGLASIIYNLVLPFNERLAETLFSPAALVIILNIPLFILAFITLNKRFALDTVICVAVYSAAMALCGVLKFPVFKGSTYESGIMLLAAVTAGVISGFCMGITLRSNYSYGGSDIVGRVIYKKNHMINVPWIIFIIDCIVVLLSGSIGLIGIRDNNGAVDVLVRIFSPMLYSFISLFVGSKVADTMQTGFTSSVVFNIITDKTTEMSEQIVKQLKRSATILTGVGGFTHQERKIVICVISRKQTVQLKKVVMEVDPAAFMYINDAKEVAGKGFTTSL